MTLQCIICWLILQYCKNKTKATESRIKHTGFVKHITNNILTVTIVNESACSSCHAKGACSAADYKEKDIEITRFTKNYAPGQAVSIVFEDSQGLKAIFYGYLLPFLFILATILISSLILHNELIIGLLAIAVLIPYYIALYFFRDRFKKVFTFEIEE